MKASCDTCGNVYDRAFQVNTDNGVYTFDSFECAIQALAPVCNHCGCRIIGHGSEADEAIYCCAHCAKQAGVNEIQDRVDHVATTSKMHASQAIGNN